MRKLPPMRWPVKSVHRPLACSRSVPLVPRSSCYDFQPLTTGLEAGQYGAPVRAAPRLQA